MQQQASSYRMTGRYPAPASFYARVLLVRRGCALFTTTMLHMLRRAAVGDTIAVVTAGGAPPSGATQWLESSAKKGPWCPIIGALRSTYSPDPDNTGRWLACRVRSGTEETRVVAPTKVQNVPGVPAPMASWSLLSSLYAAQREAAPRQRASHDAAPLDLHHACSAASAQLAFTASCSATLQQGAGHFWVAHDTVCSLMPVLACQSRIIRHNSCCSQLAGTSACQSCITYVHKYL